jgi:hypothetical protein
MTAPLGASNPLSTEYGRRLQAAVGDDRATAWAWVWYCRERYAADGDREIFRLVAQRAKANGLASILGYVAGNLTLRQLFERVRTDTADVYAQALEGAGITPADTSRDYYAETTELALEAVKACGPLRGLDDSDPRQHTRIAEAAATIWLRFLEAYHARTRQPTVAELWEGRRIDAASTPETELLEANDFRGFVIETETERADLRRSIGLEAVAVDAGRI